MASCSNSDETTDGLDNEPKMEFYLTNAQGEKQTTFNANEEIIFNLKVINNTAETYEIPYQEKFLVPQYEATNIVDVFSIYTSDGNFVGYPWDSMAVTMSKEIEPGQSINIEVPWFENKQWFYADMLFQKKEKRESLPAGSYYTLCTLYNKGGKAMVRRLDFEVK